MPSFATGLKKLFDSSQLHKYSMGSLVTDIPLTERQTLSDYHLTMSLVYLAYHLC